MFDIPTDEPKPGWIFDWNSPGGKIPAYDGDRVTTPYCGYANTGAAVDVETHPADNVGCSSGESHPSAYGLGPIVVLTAVRPVAPGGPERAPTSTYTAPPDVTRYQPSTSHRAVQDGESGECYREFRQNGTWRRSASYGDNDEACRRAAWNAYQRSQGLTLYSPNGTFPDGQPPSE